MAKQPASKLESVIHDSPINNLSSRIFTPFQLRTLNLGLKFIPTPPSSVVYRLYADSKKEIAHYNRSLWLRDFFQNNQDDSYHPRMHITSVRQWIPDKNRISASTARYTQLTSELLRLHMPVTPPSFPLHRNLRKLQLNFLNDLKQDKNIIIKPADKNLGITIMDTRWYNIECEKQLSDDKFYIQVPHVPLDDICLQLKEARKFVKRSLPLRHKTWIFQFLPPPGKPFDFNSEYKKNIPKFYIIPKIHKTPISGRPIVASHSWVLTPASIWLDIGLQPHVFRLPSVLRDTTSLIQRLNSLDLKAHPNIIFLTADVTSLYTNIPNDLGITCTKDFLDTFNIPHKELMIQLLSLILHNNFFSFRDTFFHQVSGTAMGTPVAVCYANIFMYQMVDKILQQMPGVLFYGRYIDDIFCILANDTDSHSFINRLQSLHPSLHFTVSTSKHFAVFLDVYLYKGHRFHTDGFIDTSVYQKPLNRYLYIPYSSFHSKVQKTAFIKAELLRYIRISSSRLDFLKIRRLFYWRLRLRGYPKAFLLEIFDHLKYQDRSKHLILKPKIHDVPFVYKTWSTPLTRKLKIAKLLKRHASLLRSLTNKPPIVAYRNTSNLRKTLVHA